MKPGAHQVFVRTADKSGCVRIEARRGDRMAFHDFYRFLANPAPARRRIPAEQSTVNGELP
ncbi:hypothetical protein [Amycolatopsis rubida]|uniref:hypothetical protein n=1 Tax=Amycolatopsis rubida TaxID=112413 RepID=UPI000A9C7DC8|nr:hypothetical protein [Amycolatopsis rubida]